MEQRGRKSLSALSVVSQITDSRPAPPEELLETEKELWRGVVNTKPGDWWDAASVPLLAEYCRLKTTLELMAGQLAEFQPEWLKVDDGLSRYKKLTAVRDVAQSRMTTLAMKMRLTQQSRFDERKAHTQAKKATPARVWERPG